MQCVHVHIFITYIQTMFTHARTYTYISILFQRSRDDDALDTRDTRLRNHRLLYPSPDLIHPIYIHIYICQLRRKRHQPIPHCIHLRHVYKTILYRHNPKAEKEKKQNYPPALLHTSNILLCRNYYTIPAFSRWA